MSALDFLTLDHTTQVITTRPYIQTLSPVQQRRGQAGQRRYLGQLEDTSR